MDLVKTEADADANCLEHLYILHSVIEGLLIEVFHY